MSLDTGKDCLASEVSSSSFANLRRAKSLDRRITESSMTVSIGEDPVLFLNKQQKSFLFARKFRFYLDFSIFLNLATHLKMLF